MRPSKTDPVHRRHWIFDLDGTLTVAIHDFDAMRVRLGIAPGVALLEGLRRMSAARQAAASLTIEEWEWELADRSVAAEGAEALLSALVGRGARVGILTRNLKEIALRSLEVAGLASYFEPTFVLGRRCATPKPSGDGLTRILAAWRVAPDDAVMVGDHRMDAVAGRAAGVGTILVGRFDPRDADLTVASLVELRPWWPLVGC